MAFKKRNLLKEPTRNVPIVKKFDVIVCGGVPAGIAAAISSVRTGAKTALIEMYGCLGGHKR
jgi:pyruvate/2-oxoglutarate dehydrogenase complex dihydrolipoamide dehydrogenase (E3) component